jgi:Spy/CpxP family protein refolding chaperone
MRTNIDTMKKIMLALLSLIISLAGFSQVKKDRSKMSDSTKQSIKEVMKTKKGKKMAELNLSREQKKQVKEIKQNDDAAKNAILNDAALSEEQKKEKLKELRKARQEKIKTMLTPEQKEKLKNMSQKP